MPRPQKGQKAKSIEDKEKRSYLSTVSRLKWLRNTAKKSSKLPHEFSKLTMSSFCDIDNENIGFIKISANTFKKHLTSIEKIDHNENNLIDEVKGILLYLRNDKSSKKITNSKLKDTKTQLKNEKALLLNTITNLTNDLVTIRQAYNKLLVTLENANYKDKISIKIIKDHRAEMDLYLASSNE